MPSSSSNQRFHPLTVLFALGGELRNFLLPAVFANGTTADVDARWWFALAAVIARTALLTAVMALFCPTTRSPRRVSIFESFERSPS